MVAEKFQVFSVKVTGAFASQKWVCSFFSHAPKQNFPVGSCYYPQAEGNYAFLLNSIFRKSIFSLAERREEDYGAVKMIKIKFERVLVTSFDKFHHLFNL